MKAVDYTKILSKYKSGWVALDQTKMKVVAHAKTFASITEKAKGNANLILMPAAPSYFGFIT